jgi:hypothetical protein
MAYPGVYGATRVNGGIVNQQTLTGGMRFFKIVGPFAWAVSDGTVNLNVFTTGGAVPVTTYFQVGAGDPVPLSAAELALQVVSQQADIIVIGFVPSLAGTTDEIDIAVSASAFGWGSDLPLYQVPPADADEEQLPTTPTNAALEMQAAIQALGSITVPAGGTPSQTTPPATAVVNMATVSVVEVSFSLGSLTYYTLA